MVRGCPHCPPAQIGCWLVSLSKNHPKRSRPGLSICPSWPLSTDPASSTCLSTNAPSERAGQKALSARVRPPPCLSLISLIRRRSRVEKVAVKRNTGCGSDVCSVSPPLSEAARPWQQSAQTGNPASSHHLLRPHCHHHRHGHGGLVSSRNGAILRVVAGVHCPVWWAGLLWCRIAEQGCAQ